MTLYWLSRNGDAPQGPLLLSQLRIMREQGRISAEDFICADGTEEWQSAGSVFVGGTPAAEAVRPAAHNPFPSRLRRGGWMPEDSVADQPRTFTKVLLVMALLACLSTVLYVAIAPMLKPPPAPDKRAMQRDAVRHWAVEHFRDPSTQLLEVGDPLKWYEDDLRLVRLKTEGVSHTYVIQFNWGTRQVTSWWTPAEWQERYSTTDKAVTYADTARVIADAYERHLPNAEAGADRVDGFVSKP